MFDFITVIGSIVDAVATEIRVSGRASATEAAAALDVNVSRHPRHISAPGCHFSNYFNLQICIINVMLIYGVVDHTPS